MIIVTNTLSTYRGNAPYDRAMYVPDERDYARRADHTSKYIVVTQSIPCEWSHRDSETGQIHVCQSRFPQAVHRLVTGLPVAPYGTALCSGHSPYDVRSMDELHADALNMNAAIMEARGDDTAPHLRMHGESWRVEAGANGFTQYTLVHDWKVVVLYDHATSSHSFDIEEGERTHAYSTDGTDAWLRTTLYSVLEDALNILGEYEDSQYGEDDYSHDYEPYEGDNHAWDDAYGDSDLMWEY